MDRIDKIIKKESKLLLHLCFFILCILPIPVYFFFPSHSTTTRNQH